MLGSLKVCEDIFCYILGVIILAPFHKLYHSTKSEDSFLVFSFFFLFDYSEDNFLDFLFSSMTSLNRFFYLFLLFILSEDSFLAFSFSMKCAAL